MRNTSPELGDHLASISRFLSRPLVSTLFAFHPNDLGQSLFSTPPEWDEWWDWPGNLYDDNQAPEQDPWLILLRYYESCLSGHKPSAQTSLIPPVLQSLISDACELALPRDIGKVYPGHASTSTTVHHPHDHKAQRLPGMSLKKAHEVAQLVGYIGTLMSPGSPMCNIRHVVDIGAGQVRRFMEDCNVNFLTNTDLCLRRHTCLGRYVINYTSMSLRSTGAPSRLRVPLERMPPR